MFIHDFVDHVRELNQVLCEIERNPTVLVFVALNSESIMQQQSAIGVVAVTKKDLIVRFEPI